MIKYKILLTNKIKVITTGLQLIAQNLKKDISNIIYVGDEEKDIRCAENAGAFSVLINRYGNKKDYRQNFTITNLEDLIELLRF